MSMSFHPRYLSPFFRLLYKSPPTLIALLLDVQHSHHNTISRPAYAVLTWDTFSCIIPQSPARIRPSQRPSAAIPVHEHCALLRVRGLLGINEAFRLVYSLYVIATRFPRPHFYYRWKHVFISTVL